MPLSAEMPAPVSATTGPRLRRASPRILASLDSMSFPAGDEPPRYGPSFTSGSPRPPELALARWQLLPARHRRHDACELAHAVGERRGPGLQDDGALHLVELVLHHGLDALPAWPPRDPGAH